MMRPALLSRLVMGLLLASLAACSKQPAAPVAATPHTASAPVMQPPAAAASASSVAAASSSATSDVPETTETGTTTQAGPALALRIAEVKQDAALPWKEGEHYVRLSPVRPTSAQPNQVEVTEFFWYACPHCYALDPYLETWRRKSKPAWVSLVRVPVLWSPTHGLHARIYYTAQALDQLESLHSQIFDEFQKKHHPLNTPEDVAAFFAQHGVPAASFQKAFISPSVDASLSSAQQLAYRYRVDSVPLIIINGKYLTDITKAGGPEQLIALINALAAREHRAQT